MVFLFERCSMRKAVESSSIVDVHVPLVNEMVVANWGVEPLEVISTTCDKLIGAAYCVDINSDPLGSYENISKGLVRLIYISGLHLLICKKIYKKSKCLGYIHTYTFADYSLVHD